MTFYKNKKAIAKAVTLGMVATSIVPTVVTNENVYAEKNTLTAGNKKETKVVKVTSSSLNVRDGAGTNHHIQGTVSRGNTLEYISTCNNGWYKVRYKGKIGYVSNDYSKVVGKLHTTTNNNKDSITKVGKVTGSSLKVRKGPSTKYSVIKKLSKGTKVTLVSSSNGWSKVKVGGTTGYVSSSYLSSKKQSTASSSTSSTSSSSTSTSSSKVINYAKKLLGKPYVWGAQGPNGFDCSGFTYYVFKNSAGKTLPRTSSAQSRYGTSVSKKNLKAGDLVFFDTSGPNNGAVTHCGIYIGNNKFIHAASGQGKVVINDLTSSYYVKAYVNARRVL